MIELWENLTNLLNSDPTGETKNTEKWKKVWSDLKNNTKKKAAKINLAASGTGGGPALHLKLTDLEQRVLSIIGLQAATGFTTVREAGFPQNQSDRTATLSPTPPPPPVPTESLEIAVTEESPIIHIADFNTWNIAGPSHETPIAEQNIISPTSHTDRVQLAEGNNVNIEETGSQRPNAEGHTPRRNIISPRRRRVIRHTPRRRRRIISHSNTSPRQTSARQTEMERATQNFLRTDEEWRSFLKKKHEDECNLELEKINIRKLEVESQKKWQDVAMLAIEALYKIINKN